jgi:hypothetical protein
VPDPGQRIDDNIVEYLIRSLRMQNTAALRDGDLRCRVLSSGVPCAAEARRPPAVVAARPPRRRAD